MHGEPLLRIVPATVHGRFRVAPPGAGAARGLLVGFHGYAQQADVFLDYLRRSPSTAGWLVCSVQALHPFYAGRTQDVVANWMTRQDREHAIADNIAYVDRVMAALQAEFGSPRRLVFAGFSQGVAMAWRAAVAGSTRCDALFAVGGDIPPEIRPAAGPGWPAVTVCTGDRDDFYTQAMATEDTRFLVERGVRAVPAVFPGGHEWSAEVVATLDRLLLSL